MVNFPIRLNSEAPEGRRDTDSGQDRGGRKMPWWDGLHGASGVTGGPVGAARRVGPVERATGAMAVPEQPVAPGHTQSSQPCSA